MSIPANLKYTKEHEWVRVEGDVAYIGITDYAQSELGDIVFINLPGVGNTVAQSEVFADVESVKAVSDVFCPVTGTVTAVNEALLTAPELINANAFDAWLVKVGDITDKSALMDAEAYRAFTEK